MTFGKNGLKQKSVPAYGIRQSEKNDKKGKGGRGGRGGKVKISILGKLCGGVCLTFVVAENKKCLDKAQDDLEFCLAGAVGNDPDLNAERIAICKRIAYLDQAECATIYIAESLACALPSL